MTNKKEYRQVMVETMLVESLTNNEARFSYLFSNDMSLQEVATVARAMKLLIDNALDQAVQKIIDNQAAIPPPPTNGSFFDPSMN